jgi:hypothetical protein
LADTLNLQGFFGTTWPLEAGQFCTTLVSISSCFLYPPSLRSLFVYSLRPRDGGIGTPARTNIVRNRSHEEDSDHPSHVAARSRPSRTMRHADSSFISR